MAVYSISLQRYLECIWHRRTFFRQLFFTLFCEKEKIMCIDTAIWFWNFYVNRLVRTKVDERDIDEWV